MMRPEAPVFLAKSHRVEGPKRMVITGDVKDAERIENVRLELEESARYGDSSFYTSVYDSFFLSLPHGDRESKGCIREKWSVDLVKGAGIGEDYGEPTEAMFCGPKRRDVSPEGLVWLGRALAEKSLERVFYLDPSGIARGIRHAKGLEDLEELTIINHPLEVYRLVSKDDGSEVQFSDLKEKL